MHTHQLQTQQTMWLHKTRPVQTAIQHHEKKAVSIAWIIKLVSKRKFLKLLPGPVSMELASTTGLVG